ncbi:glycosyltransferase involved in cell wall biosynthesis [Oceanihabitans sediminis]|uniref:Glycosyltransferase family 2 protein n=1 Tax=Oceanihabitans sediminis TaxID=1812012 RepID=A0A368P3H9_9FLAO|nr:glycosyltransferase family 2 protein [Oceanihabitans sediminis]RBP30865.1 glycosyltransferase involved in cell wall biosynthesis [Oceanihabitans sediminis]RCU56830.1 glycosyltransferase family 2 protein [Oceanihabitans sediminis]
MPELTVIMPVYNGESFLPEAIDSVLNQTFSNFKLLILDDNSKDKTSKILEDYKQKDSRVEVVTKAKNVGPANLRNEGIALAETEYIALLDADDIALTTRFEKQIAFLKDNSEYGVCGTWFTFFGDKKNKKVRHEVDHDSIKIQMLNNCCIGNPTVMFKKSHLEGLHFENEYVPAEDYGLWSQLTFKTKFYNIPESLVLYRWHPNNISQKKVENLRKAEVVIKKKQLNHIGIPMNDENMEFYLNAVSIKKGLSKKEIKNTIEASKKLIQLNAEKNIYKQDLFISHIDKTIIRSIRNCKENTQAYYKYIKSESGYYSKISTLDAIVLYFKCLF